jgi:hypothetical protein
MTDENEIPAEDFPVEEIPPIEDINQISITNNSQNKKYYLYSNGVFIKEIDAGSCFGYMVQPEHDLTISLNAPEEV